MREFSSLSGPLVLTLERSAVAVGRLDHAVTGHPLRRAWSHRTRLDAAQRHARADGGEIDPLRLAALIEGLRLTSDPTVSLLDRAGDHLALGHAFRLYGWMQAAEGPLQPTAEDPTAEDDKTDRADRQQAVAAALGHFAALPESMPTLVAAGLGLRSGLDAGLGRGPLRAALPRYLADRGLVRGVLPGLTGAKVLHGDDQDDPAMGPTRWLVTFLEAVTIEATEGVQLLRAMTRAWADAHSMLAARGRLAGRRRLRCDSALPRAVDLLAATPFLGPARLSRVLGCSVRGAALLMAELVTLGVAAEVTGRRTHRLYAMADLAAVRDQTRGPRRPLPPAREMATDMAREMVPLPEPRLPERVALEVDLEALVADLDRVIRRTRDILTEKGCGALPQTPLGP